MDVDASKAVNTISRGGDSTIIEAVQKLLAFLPEKHPLNLKRLVTDLNGARFEVGLHSMRHRESHHFADRCPDCDSFQAVFQFLSTAGKNLDKDYKIPLEQAINDRLTLAAERTRQTVRWPGFLECTRCKNAPAVPGRFCCAPCRAAIPDCS